MRQLPQFKVTMAYVQGVEGGQHQCIQQQCCCFSTAAIARISCTCPSVLADVFQDECVEAHMVAIGNAAGSQLGLAQWAWQV